MRFESIVFVGRLGSDPIAFGLHIALSQYRFGQQSVSLLQIPRGRNYELARYLVPLVLKVVLGRGTTVKTLGLVDIIYIRATRDLGAGVFRSWQDTGVQLLADSKITDQTLAAIRVVDARVWKCMSQPAISLQGCQGYETMGKLTACIARALDLIQVPDFSTAPRFTPLHTESKVWLYNITI